jgi:hypothetical protein
VVILVVHVTLAFLQAEVQRGLSRSKFPNPSRSDRTRP